LKTNDLLALHYDNCPDKDDGHAIPAGKSIVEKFGINNVMVVNGRYGMQQTVGQAHYLTVLKFGSLKVVNPISLLMS